MRVCWHFLIMLQINKERKKNPFLQSRQFKMNDHLQPSFPLPSNHPNPLCQRKDETKKGTFFPPCFGVQFLQKIRKESNEQKIKIKLLIPGSIFPLCAYAFPFLPAHDNDTLSAVQNGTVETAHTHTGQEEEETAEQVNGVGSAFCACSLPSNSFAKRQAHLERHERHEKHSVTLLQRPKCMQDFWKALIHMHTSTQTTTFR